MIEMEIAKSLGLKVTGTIGLIYMALKQESIISNKN